MLAIVSGGGGGVRWLVGHCERSNAVGGWGSRCVVGGQAVTGGVPRHPTPCIYIGVVLGVHFCGSYPQRGEVGGGGGEVFEVSG